MQHNNNERRDGFTLIEMLIVAPIVLVTIATFVGVIIFITGEVLGSRANNSLAYNIQDALNTIEDDVRLSSAFLATNNVTIASPQGYDNNTQSFQNAGSSNGEMLILNSMATTSTYYSPDRKLIPLKNLPNDCSSAQANQNQMMTLNTIYFVKDKALWKRTLLPSNYQTKGCNGAQPWQKPSCNAGTGGICTTKDTKLVELSNTSDSSLGFDIQYYTTPQSTAELTAASTGTNAATRQTALRTASSVVVTINATENVAGRSISYSATLRATRIGSLIEYATPVP